MKFILSVIKYFTNLSPEKAVRFILFLMIICMAWYMIYRDKKNAENISNIKDDFKTSILECKEELKKNINEKDSLYKLYIREKKEDFDKEISILKKLLEKSERLKNGN